MMTNVSGKLKVDWLKASLFFYREKNRQICYIHTEELLLKILFGRGNYKVNP